MSGHLSPDSHPEVKALRESTEVRARCMAMYKRSHDALKLSFGKAFDKKHWVSLIEGKCHTIPTNVLSKAANEIWKDRGHSREVLKWCHAAIWHLSQKGDSPNSAIEAQPNGQVEVR